MNFGGYSTISFNGATVGPPVLPPAATYFEALRAYLKSLSALVTLTDVYKRKPAKGWSYPYMVISAVSGAPDINNSWDYPNDTEYQFDTLSNDDIEAEALGEAAYAALLPKGNPVLAFDGGIEVVRMPLYHERMMESSSRGPGNVNTWTHSFGYRVTKALVMPGAP